MDDSGPSLRSLQELPILPCLESKEENEKASVLRKKESDRVHKRVVFLIGRGENRPQMSTKGNFLLARHFLSGLPYLCE